MGEELQLGVALQVKKEMENIPSNLLGIIFMTHSRIFVREFMKMENSSPLNHFQEKKYMTILNHLEKRNLH